jgi:hypothetical protein
VKEAAHRELWFCVPLADSGHYAAARFAALICRAGPRQSKPNRLPSIACSQHRRAKLPAISADAMNQMSFVLSLTIRGFFLRSLFVAALRLFPFSGRDENAPDHGSNRYRDDNKQARPTQTRASPINSPTRPPRPSFEIILSGLKVFQNLIPVTINPKTNHYSDFFDVPSVIPQRGILLYFHSPSGKYRLGIFCIHDVR